MSKIFNSIPLVKPKRSFFDLTHSFKFTGRMGDLIPTCCIDCVPGDTFKLGGESMTRFAPMIAPVYERFHARQEYFFVPKRILWPNFENYMTNNKLGDVTPQYPFFNLLAAGTNYTKLADYFGLPDPSLNPDSTTDEKLSLLPFAAYANIWDEYYRDQNLQDSILEQLFGMDGRTSYLVDGDNSSAYDNVLKVLRKRAWTHDYFTSCLPFAQKGNPVSLPLATFEDVPVKRNAAPPPFQETWDGVSGNQLVVDNETTLAGSVAAEHLYADTSTLVAESATISELRRAYALQRYFERLAVAGTRFTEWIRGIFGVKTSDARLQRPEYIVGTKSPIVVSEVLNTTGTEDAPQGNMSGHAIALTRGNWGTFFCEEPGYIIGLYSVLPETAYFQGIAKHWLKINNPEENFIPQFEHIGEQSVLNKELFAFRNDGTSTFGYLPRYTEYKFESNRIAGDFKTSLDFWTCARKFDDLPALNAAFIESDPTKRIFAVQDADVDELWVQLVNHVQAIRPMSKFSTPI